MGRPSDPSEARPDLFGPDRQVMPDAAVKQQVDDPFEGRLSLSVDEVASPTCTYGSAV